MTRPGASPSPPRRPLRTVADPAVLALLAAVVLAGVQAAVLGPLGRILGAAVPYALALVTLLAVRWSMAAPTGRVGGGKVDGTVGGGGSVQAGPVGAGGVDGTVGGDGSVQAGPGSGGSAPGSGGSAPAGEGWVRGLAVAGALLSLWLLAMFLRALPSEVGREFGFYRLKVQVTSPLGDHNTAAGLLLVAVVAAIVLASRDRRWYLVTGLISLGLVATLSRAAALLLAVVAVTAWLWASERRTAIAATLVAVVVAGGVFGAALLLDASPPPPATGTAGPLADAGAGPLGVSILGRADLAVRGVRLGAERPLLGVGLGGFREHAGDLPAPNDHAHQLFAHAFAEGGVVLLAVALTLPLVLLVRVLRLPRSRLRDVTLLGGLGLVAHAQVEILGGRAGYELALAVLVGLAGAWSCREPGPGP